LELYREEGLGFIDKIEGSFAIALWDDENQRLVLAIDRMGIKALYWRRETDKLLFATRLSAIRAAQRDSVRIHKSALMQFFVFGATPAPLAIDEGTQKLCPGHLLVFERGHVRQSCYWDLQYVEEQGSTAASWAEGVRTHLRAAVDTHLDDCVSTRTGSFLSGGTDSSTVVAFASNHVSPLPTFTIYFREPSYNEIEFARTVSSRFQTEAFEECLIPDTAYECISSIVRAYDEPFGDSAAWSNYLIAQFARREVTVALSGEGGDEIFCGYPRYWSNVGARSNLLNRTLAEKLPPLSRFASSMQRYSAVGLPAFAIALGGLAEVQIDALLADDWQERGYDYLWFYRQFWSPDLDPLTQLRWLDLNTDLAEGLLTKVDRTSMAHSLEVRPPLLDHRLVEFMLTVHPAMLVDRRRRRGKLLVRRLMQPRLPPGHLERPKSGFGLPVHRWLKHHPQVLQGAVTRLMARGVLRRPVGTEFRRAWYLLVLDRWFTAFG